MAFQDLKRVRTIAGVAGRYGFIDLLERVGFKKQALGDIGIEAHCASPVARRFRLLLADLGPTFVKLGQMLSTRGDLLPADFIDELSELQDNVSPVHFEQVQAQVCNALHCNLDDAFAEFSPLPLAAASIAQIHHAKTHRGESVIVKVQRPHIVEQIRADLSVLHYIARVLETVFEEVGTYSPSSIIEEFDRAIHEELDFMNEASNIRAFYSNYKDHPHIRIPKVYEALSARTVLTMEFIDAPKLSRAQLDTTTNQTLAKIILEESFLQIFEFGLFHGDPHPGNLLVLPGPVLALIDFGLVGRVSRQMQETLIQLVLAIALKDAELVAQLLYRLGSPDSRSNLKAFRQDIEPLLGAYLPTTLQAVDTKHLLCSISNLAIKYRIRIPKEFAILSRSAISIEGILRDLYPQMPVGELFLPYAKKILAGQYGAPYLQGSMLKTLLRFHGAVRDVPAQLTQLMIDLESGKFTITIKTEQLQEMNKHLRTLAVIVFAGLCACGFIIGTFIAFASKQWDVWGVPVLGLFAIGCTVFLFSAVLLRQAWGSLRKMSFKRLLSRRIRG